MSASLDFGSLNERLERSNAAENLERSLRVERAALENVEGLREITAGELREIGNSHTRNIMRSAGPISDAYILGTEPRQLITGPGGSGKTTASVKKALVESQRIAPGTDGVRRYVLGVWRQKYDNLWKATIPSWWKILPADLPGSKWTGSSPRAAEHIVRFEDQWGRVELIARFRAFGDAADPEDLRGNEFTDCYLNEMNTMSEDLFGGLADRVGRDPPYEIIKRTGCIFGDANPPDVLNWTYRDFYEDPKPGHVLYRQPGGRHAEAENIQAVGRAYYENSAMTNAHRPWWVRVMVDAKPGYVRSNAPVYPKFDDDRNIATQPLHVFKELPILVGIDNPMKPAAVYCQERGNGQLRVLAEIALERGGVKELSVEMLALEARLFPGGEFVDTCDPAMVAGEDTDLGSDRSRLAVYLGRDVKLADSNSLDTRIQWVADKLDLSVEDGAGLVIDPRCKALRRGFNQTYAWRDIAGTNDRGSIAKTADSHPMEALQYAASRCGSSEARRRTQDRTRELERIRAQGRDKARAGFNPLRRARG